MGAAVETPAETDANVEASQDESVVPDISQAYEHVEGVDADQETFDPALVAEQVEGQEAPGDKPEAQAQEGAEEEGVAKEAEEIAGADELVSQQTPVFDEELLSRAQQVGIPEHRARAQFSPETLRTTINELVWREPRVLREEAAPATPKEQELTVEHFKVGEAFDADDLGEDLAKRLNVQRDQSAVQMFEQHTAHQKQMEDIKMAMGGMIARSEASQQQGDADTFENWVAATPELHQFLGKGRTDTLKPDSPQVKLRNRIFHRAKRVAVMYREEGEAKSPADALSDAAAIVLNKQRKTAARQELTSKMTSRKDQSLAKPTQMPGPQASAEERAAAIMDEYEAEHPVPREETF